MTDDPSKLQAAYALEGTDQVRALYRDWAASYDSDFVASMGYALPGLVADAFREAGGSGPVLDVGCGSGAVGRFLPGLRLDGIDLSPEMLAMAVRTGRYTRLVEADLLERLPLDADSYRGVVSAGTFTHGHVGPEALEELLRVAMPGALFCLSINAEHYAARGFAGKLDELEARDRIDGAALAEHPIYRAEYGGRDDRAFVVTFRRR